MASAALRIRFHSTWRSWPVAASTMTSVGSVGRDADLLAPLLLERAHDLRHLFAQIQTPALFAARARVVEQVGDQAIQAIDLAHGDVHQLAAVGVGAGRRLQHLHRARDAGQRIADLVGDAGGQAPDAGQALGALDLELHAAQLGQILKVNHPSDDAAGVVGQRRRRDAEVAHGAVGAQRR